MSFIQNFAIMAHMRFSAFKSNAVTAIQQNPGVLVALFGLTLMALPDVVLANGLSGQLDRWSGTIKDLVDFVMTLAVLVGVGAIFYGCKLIMDKANDRADVKNGHIVVSFVGGAFLCILWFIVTMLAETAGDGTVGEGASF